MLADWEHEGVQYHRHRYYILTEEHEAAAMEAAVAVHEGAEPLCEDPRDEAVLRNATRRQRLRDVEASTAAVRTEAARFERSARQSAETARVVDAAFAEQRRHSEAAMRRARALEDEYHETVAEMEGGE